MSDLFECIYLTGLAVAGLAQLLQWAGLGRGTAREPEMLWAEELP